VTIGHEDRTYGSFDGNARCLRSRQ
jgi:hypothetical protein